MADRYEIRAERDKSAEPVVFRPGGRKHYKVRIYIWDNQAKAVVVPDDKTKVVYNLHKSFKEPTRIGDSSEPGFPVDIRTYGYFPITASIEGVDGAPIPISGEVKFD